MHQFIQYISIVNKLTQQSSLWWDSQLKYKKSIGQGYVRMNSAYKGRHTKNICHFFVIRFSWNNLLQRYGKKKCKHGKKM